MTYRRLSLCVLSFLAVMVMAVGRRDGWQTGTVLLLPHLMQNSDVLCLASALKAAHTHTHTHTKIYSGAYRTNVNPDTRSHASLTPPLLVVS